MKFLVSTFIILVLCRCGTIRTANRGHSNPTSPRVQNISASQQEILKMYGIDQKIDEVEKYKSILEKKFNVKKLESNFTNNKEREKYFQIKPWLLTDEEKVAYLNLQGPFEKQNWLVENKIYERMKSIPSFIKPIVESEDISVGMPQDWVLKSWGLPHEKKASGNPLYKNEVWVYKVQKPTTQGYQLERREIFFEGGQVVGWRSQ